MGKQQQKVYKFMGDCGHQCLKITAGIIWQIVNEVNTCWEQMLTQ